MTLHHVPDPAALIVQLSGALLPGGTLAVADLDAEDGSFHGDNTGVLHLGFDRVLLVRNLFQQGGLREVRDVTAAWSRRRSRERDGGNFPCS